MSLATYRGRRDFRKTPEPRGRVAHRRDAPTFAVQKHAASRLHFDFRLEIDGVLKSWAVPKGPSLDPGVRALALQVEDHPLDYGTFEGIIPAGQYGGGTVMLWDRGTWESDDGDPRGAYGDGHLNFRLYGQRLAGAWTLHRTNTVKGRVRWLLIKRRDDAARPGDAHGVVERELTSVTTRRTMQAIAACEAAADNRDRPPAKRTRGAKSTAPRTRRVRSSRSDAENDAPSVTSSQARRGRPTADFTPQRATLAAAPPTGDEWLHEMKFDGYRLSAFHTARGVRLVTRNGKNWTSKFRSLAQAIGRMPFTGLLDGELVALDSTGVSDFQRLQNAGRENRAAELVFHVFDLPYLNDDDLRRVPLVERKAALERLVLASFPRNDGPVRYSEHVRGHGEEVLKQACRRGLEGIVSKRADAPYESRRTRTWLKLKCHGRQELVVGGYTKPAGARSGFGALLVGYFDSHRKLRFGGKVGTGFDSQTLRTLKHRMDALAVEESPFVDAPRSATRGAARWIRPELVAEIKFTEWTADGHLRHPSFQGLRDDKAAREVVRESMTREALRRESSGEPIVAGVRLTHPDRVLFPDGAITKQDLAAYFATVADHILPHVVHRPLTLVRCPDGAAGKCFVQKHWTERMPAGIRKVAVPGKSGSEWYVTVVDAAGLASLVQIGVVELHPWGSRGDALDRPDQMIFDLDPGPEVEWSEVVRAAIDLRDVLTELKLRSFVKTTGGKGVHVVVPLRRRSTWEKTAAAAGSISSFLARLAPERFVTNMRKDLRRGKIFIDHFRNRRGATAVAPYSTRGRSGAPVAVPVTWSELERLSSPAEFTLEDVPARLKRLGPRRNPWKDYFETSQTLTVRVLTAARRLAGSEATD